MVSPQTKEWLCLTCQMQRALTATESAEPPLMKPPSSPNKMFTSAAAAKDAPTNQMKNGISIQKAEVPDKIQKDIPTPSAPQKREDTKSPLQIDITQASTTASPSAKETVGTVSVPSKGETTSLPPTDNVPIPTSPPTKEMAISLSHPCKSLPVQAPQVNTGIEISLQKEIDLNSPSPHAIKEVSEKKEEKDEIVQKSTEQLVKPSEVQLQQAPNKDTNLVERSPATSIPPTPQLTNQESGGFFSFGSPKSQRAASLTTEAVTGKMLGFGTSLFSSASTLITAVQEESRTTPPSSRKMSAPVQVSEKMSASPKSSPPVSPKLTSAKETNISASPKHVEKPKEQQPEVPTSGQTKVDKGPLEPAKPEAPQSAPKEGQSTCPLCKAELNMGSKNLPNYNTCTGCKTTVCNKCGFSPMPNVAEVIKSPNTSLISSFVISVSR